MPKVIYKYPIKDRTTHLVLPFDFLILHADTINDEVFIWARVESYSNCRKVDVKIVVIDTGQEVSPFWEYIGTVKLKSDTIVHHLYRIP